MNINIIDQASKKWSGIVLAQYFTDFSKAFRIAPLLISDSMIIRTRKDISPDDSTLDTTMGAFSPSPIRHTELDEVEIKLKGRSVEEPIGITNKIIASEDESFNITEYAMAGCAKKLGKDLFADLNTILTAAGTYSAAREIDLAGGTYVKWSVPATAKPRANILELKQKLVDAAQIEEDDPRITLALSTNVYRYLLNTAEYIAYKASDQNDWRKDQMQRLRDFFELSNVMVLPPNYFDDIAVLAIVDNPIESFSISNPNLNMSALLTGAYNLRNVNQPLKFKMANGLMITESRVFIGAREYERQDGLATMAQAFTWNKVFIHNANGIARLKNID